MAYPYQAGPTLSPAAQQAISTYQLGAYHSEFKVGLTRHYLTGLIAGLIITLLFGFILINTGNDSSNVLLVLFLLGLILLLYYVVDF